MADFTTKTEFIGKNVKLYYDDTQRVMKKEGVITEITDFSIILNKVILIPKSRIVRVEFDDKTSQTKTDNPFQL